MQPERLSNLSGSELAAVALEHKSNVALFEKLLLACVNKQQKAEFISHVSKSLFLKLLIDLNGCIDKCDQRPVRGRTTTAGLYPGRLVSRPRTSLEV